MSDFGTMSDKWSPLEGYRYFEINEDGVVRSSVTKKVYGKWDEVRPRQ